MASMHMYDDKGGLLYEVFSSLYGNIIIIGIPSLPLHKNSQKCWTKHWNKHGSIHVITSKKSPVEKLNIDLFRFNSNYNSMYTHFSWLYLSRQENGNSAVPWKDKKVVERIALGTVCSIHLFKSNPYLAKSDAYKKTTQLAAETTTIRA